MCWAFLMQDLLSLQAKYETKIKLVAIKSGREVTYIWPLSTHPEELQKRHPNLSKNWSSTLNTDWKFILVWVFRCIKSLRYLRENGESSALWKQSFHVGAWCRMSFSYQLRGKVLLELLVNKNEVQQPCYSKQIQNTFQYCSRVKILWKRDDKKDIIFTFLFGMVFSFFPWRYDGNITFFFLVCPVTSTIRLGTLCWKVVSSALTVVFRSGMEKFPKAWKSDRWIKICIANTMSKVIKRYQAAPTTFWKVGVPGVLLEPSSCLEGSCSGRPDESDESLAVSNSAAKGKIMEYWVKCFLWAPLF